MVGTVPTNIFDFLEIFNETSGEINLEEAQNETSSLIIFVEINAPFAYYDDQKGIYRGIEIYLVESIAKRLHLDIVFISDRENDGFGKFDPKYY